MMKRKRPRYAIEIPKLGSLILTHSLDGEVPGLKDFPRDERPDAFLVFFCFPGHGWSSGFLMLGLALWGAMAALAGQSLPQSTAASGRRSPWDLPVSSP